MKAGSPVYGVEPTISFIGLGPSLCERDFRIWPHSEFYWFAILHIAVNPSFTRGSHTQVQIVPVVEHVFFRARLGRFDLSFA